MYAHQIISSRFIQSTNNGLVMLSLRLVVTLVICIYIIILVLQTKSQYFRFVISYIILIVTLYVDKCPKSSELSHFYFILCVECCMFMGHASEYF